MFEYHDARGKILSGLLYMYYYNNDYATPECSTLTTYNFFIRYTLVYYQEKCLHMI